MAQGVREERTNTTQNMVSISWYLPEKVRDEMSKKTALLNFRKIFFQNLLSYIHLYVYIYIRTVAQGGREKENKRHLFQYKRILQVSRVSTSNK